jgi:death-on-curing protein
VTTPAWRWIKESSVLAIHEEQIAEHGGLAGIRDMPLLLSALGRPQNLAAYGSPDIADLAAAYAVGIARNHAFLDGNKRTAWVVAETFLLKNGYDLVASDRDGVTTMLAVADGTMSEPELAVWFRTYIRPLNTK